MRVRSAHSRSNIPSIRRKRAPPTRASFGTAGALRRPRTCSGPPPPSRALQITPRHGDPGALLAIHSLPSWSSRDGEKRESRNGRAETGAERLRPSNSEGRSQPASSGNIPPRAAPLPPLLIQTPAGAKPLPRLSNQTHGYTPRQADALI
jgi:hypothetical protein